MFTGQGSEARYDADRGRVIVLQDSAGTADSDEVWQRTADGWSVLCDSCTGTPRYAASIVHVPDYDQTFIIGGQSTGAPDLDGTWVLVGDQFERLDTFHDIPPRWNAGVVYDPSRDVVVLDGGNGCGDPLVACELVEDVTP